MRFLFGSFSAARAHNREISREIRAIPRWDPTSKCRVSAALWPQRASQRWSANVSRVFPINKGGIKNATAANETLLNIADAIGALGRLCVKKSMQVSAPERVPEVGQDGLWSGHEQRGLLVPSPFIEYVLAIPVAAASTLACELIAPWAQLADLVMVHLLGVVAIAVHAAVGPSLFAAVVSVLSFDYFFIPPNLQFAWPDAGSILTFVGMVVVAGVISRLNQGLRKEREAARRSEAFVNALYQFSQALSEVHSIEQLSAFAERRLSKLFDAHVRVALQSGDSVLPFNELESDSAEERALALAAWKKGELVHDPGVSGLNVWLTLNGAHRSVGLVGLAPRSSRHFLQVGGQPLLLACAGQLASAVERLLLSGATHRAELQAETERTRSALLAAVSHDLRNPLAAILTAASTAARPDSQLGDSERRGLMRTIMAESERLNRLVANLLSMTKLESGELRLQRLPEELPELVDNALRSLSGALAAERIEVRFQTPLPAVDVDAVLVEQVLINLLENALRYAPPSTRVEVEASDGPEVVRVRVVDHGPGIRAEERAKVFEKFFRAAGARRDGGAGLGLTICRAVITLHHGKICVLETPGGGATVEFTLPRAATTCESEDE